MFNLFVQAFNRHMLTGTAKPVKPTALQRRRPSRQHPGLRTGLAEPARPDRKADILLAAEKLFAQRGYHAVTIREIAQEAGVPLALVGYYYGPKHDLFHAIFAHWNGTIEERMHALRSIAIDSQDASTLPRIVDAFTGPVLRLRASSEGEYYALLVARELYHLQEETDRVMRAYFDPLAFAFIDALAQALPHASRSQVAWCYQFALGALLHHISDSRVERLSHNESKAGDPAAAGLLTAFIVGGFRAALPAPTALSG